jgi:multimeric flavodoxin WrbA
MPLDDMSTMMYPKILRADILFCSTPVNQSTMSTRLKAFCDRMISLDGGVHITAKQYHPKDQEWRSKMMALSASGKVSYDQRLYGRVAGYFISSKDDQNPLPIGNKLKNEFDRFSYIEKTANVLKDGMEDYGYFHSPDGWYAGFAAVPDEDYMWDKQTLNNDEKALVMGRDVVANAIKLAKKLKKDLPPFKTDRINRT